MTDDMKEVQREFYESALKRLEQNAKLPFSVRIEPDKSAIVLTSCSNTSKKGEIRIGNNKYITENIWAGSEGKVVQLDDNGTEVSKRDATIPERLEIDHLVRSLTLGQSIS